MGSISVSLQASLNLNLCTFHESFPDLSKRIILVVSELSVTRESRMLRLAHSVSSECEKLGQALPQECHVLELIVFVRVVLEEKSVSISHIIPDCKIISCGKIRMIYVLRVSALSF